ncbi:8834_t:CDS:2 [Cetraspora pellucida]|uniref:8834_t:CDS:1 n=1 Tax=Cetraspora pellucida TaxID=1433469 RepID=A0A9N8YQE8_9GLOM|nr:8834_t:CDS:2 [Cetraspora pellucida]
MTKRTAWETFDSYSYIPSKKKNKFSNDVFTHFFGNDVDGFSLYHNMKNASNKLNPMNISGLPCNMVCDPEDATNENIKQDSFSPINSIISIFFNDASYIDTFGLFETDIMENYISNHNDDSIKYGIQKYTNKNLVTNSLIALNRFGQTISKDVPKAPRLKLHGFFCQVDMSIVMNTEKNNGIDLNDNLKLFEPSGNFIITLSLLIAKNENIFIKEKIDLEDIFKKGTYRFDNTDNNMASRLNQDNWELMTAIDTPININELLENNKSKCCNKPFWHNFSIYIYYSHTQSMKGQKSTMQGMPYGVKKVDEDKNIIIYCCDKNNQTNMIGYQPNVVWVLTVTIDPKSLKKKIENGLKLDLEYNNNITFFGIEPKFPTHTGPFLLVDKIIPMMAYDTNMDSMSNLKFTTSSAMQQLVDAVKAAINNPENINNNDDDSIISYYKKKINEKTKICDLQPGSELYDLIQNDNRLGTWHIKELNNIIKEKGKIIIEDFKSLIIHEKNNEKIEKYINSLKKINAFFLDDKNKFIQEIDLLKSNLKIINQSKLNPDILKIHVIVKFNSRKNNSFRLKPIYFPFGYPIKRIINLIIKRYNTIIESNTELNKHLYNLILYNLKSYKESFYIKPWKSLIYHGIHKNRNNSFYMNIKKIDKRLFLEIVDLLLSVTRNDDISFFNTLHLKIVNTDNNLIQCVKLNPYNNYIQNSDPSNIEYFYKIINNPYNHENHYNPSPYINNMDNLHEDY